MRYELFTQVARARDIPDKSLLAGDVATIVEPLRSGEVLSVRQLAAA